MRAIIYARVSSLGNRQKNERQVSDLKQYAILNGYEVVETFQEQISGAKKNSERSELKKALDFCVEKGIEMVLVSELSRLGRNTFEVLDTIKLLIDKQINLFLQKEQFLLLDKISRKPASFTAVMLATLSTCAELERENIVFRLNSGRELYKANGGRLGCPVGTRMSREEVIKKYRQPIKLLKEGYSIRKVAKLTDVSESTVKRLKKGYV